MHKLKHLACIKSTEITTKRPETHKYPKSSYSNKERGKNARKIWKWKKKYENGSNSNHYAQIRTRKGKGDTSMMIGRAPRASNPKWLQSQCMEMKSGEEWGERMEEKRGRRWRGWLGFGSGEVNTNKKKNIRLPFIKSQKRGVLGKWWITHLFTGPPRGPLSWVPRVLGRVAQRFGQHTDAPKMRANNSDRLK